MNSFLVSVNDKTVYIHFESILEYGDLIISNEEGETVYQKTLSNSHYEIISLDQPNGKYWTSIDTGKTKSKKSFHLK